MSHIFDEWNTTLVALKSSLSLVGYLPHEVTYEIQNALVHLLVALKSSPEHKRKEVKRAIAHMRRAHLDALKICLFEIHTRVAGTLAGNNCDSSIKFQKRFAQARLAELQQLGTQRDRTDTEFQDIIREFAMYRSTHNFSLNLPPTALAQTNENYCIFDYNCRDILWQWAQLEILLTSLRGQRVYAVSYNMVIAYLAWANFMGELQKTIPSLKAAIIMVLITNDCNNAFSSFLCSVPEGNIFWRIRQFIKKNPTLAEPLINKLYTRMAQSATALFPCILEYLDISFQETLAVAA